MVQSSMVETPVLVLAFNRPGLTNELWHLLRQVKPRQIYFACDGPREGAIGDSERVKAVQDSVKLVDWECDVRTLFQSRNLGCCVGVSTAISWFLEEQPAGIILEDDVRPSVDFFPFAADMLLRYEDESRVWSVAATNLDPLPIRTRQSSSYRFSSMPLIWGWATWARAWKSFSRDLTGWNGWLDLSQLRRRHELPYPAQLILRKRICDAAARRTDSWDTRWMARSLAADSLHVVPRPNLASNVGFATDPTHVSYRHPLIREAESMPVPLKHPSDLTPDLTADRAMFRDFFEATWPGLARKSLRKAGLQLRRLPSAGAAHSASSL